MVEIRVDGPTRTCVGCRQRVAASELLRVTLVENAVVPDPRRTASGRGAHLHPSADCLALAERKRAFVRALRFPGGQPLDLTQVEQHLDRLQTAAHPSRTPQEMEH